MGQPAKINGIPAREHAPAEVSDVLLSIEYALARARRAHTAVKKAGLDRNRELALADAVDVLAKAHKRLMQDTYYNVNDTERMF